MSHFVTQFQKSLGPNNQSLFDHLQELLHKILNEPSSYSSKVDFFELFSDFTKKNSFQYKTPQRDEEVNQHKEQIGEFHNWIQSNLKLFAKSSKLNASLHFPNFLQDSQILEFAGFSFSEEENFRIYQSLKVLAAETKAKELRFWGKILTRTRDYYVAEGVSTSISAEDMPSGSESKGEGVNYCTHWVTYDVLDEWFELPCVTPQQIKQARQIKYVFTGNLNEIIKSNPPFAGKEKHLLKAQIARISGATVLVPKGLYKAQEEKPKEIEFEEEPLKLPEYGELKNPENWVHLHPAILNLGRCSHWVDPNLKEEQKEAELAELTEKDPEIERLKGITEEKSPFSTGAEGEDASNWQVREFGDLQQFNMIGKEEGSVSTYGTVVLKNITWPGSALVANTKGWCNVYVGYGLKVNQSPFVPLSPDEIQMGQDDLQEQPEPNHIEPPKQEEAQNAEQEQNE